MYTGPFDNHPTVVTIKNRMAQRGVDLLQFIWEIRPDPWTEPPIGFDFAFDDIDSYHGLERALILNKNFGMDSMLGGSQHPGVSFREVSQPDSLHVTMSKSLIIRDTPACSIHLDTVSPVRGVNKTTGVVIYDEGKLLQHVTSDLAHTPMVIVPGGRTGLAFGWRF